MPPPTLLDCDATLRLLVGSGLAAPTWAAPPQALLRFLHELFSEQPADVLQWAHQAAWRLRTEELTAGHLAGQLSPGPAPRQGEDAAIPDERLLRDDAAKPDSTAILARLVPRKRPFSPPGPATPAGPLTYGPQGDERTRCFSATRSHSVPRLEIDTLSRSAASFYMATSSPSAEGVQNYDSLRIGPTSSAAVPVNMQSTAALALVPEEGDGQGKSDGEGGSHDLRAESSNEDLRAESSDQRSSTLITGSSVGITGSSVSKASSCEDPETAMYLEKFFGRPDMNRLASGFPTMKSTVSSVLHSKRLTFDSNSYRYILSPISGWRWLWDCLLFVALIAVLWTTFFELAFVPDSVTSFPAWYLGLNAGLCIFLVLDIVLTFFTGYISNGNVILDPLEIAKNYLRTWFVLDVIATFPTVVELIIDPFYIPGQPWGILRATRALQFRRTIKSLKLLRVISYSWREGYGLHSFVFASIAVTDRMGFFFYAVVLFIVLYFVSFFNAMVLTQSQAPCPIPDGAGLDWAFEMCFADVGRAYALLLGMHDLQEWRCHDVASWESGAAIFAKMLISTERVVMQLLILSWLLWRAAHTHVQSAASANLQKGALAYLKYHRVSPNLQFEAFRSMHETDKVRRKRRNFQQLYQEFLPPYVRRRICSELWGDKLVSLDLVLHLTQWDPHFLSELTQVVREEIITSKVVLFSAGETSNFAYKITKGEFAVTYHEDKMLVPNYTAGMWAGEKALVNPDLRRLETFVSVAWCELMVVAATDFWRLVHAFNLKQRFDELLKQKLPNGQCGRCGSLGTHFDIHCPLVLANREASYKNCVQGSGWREALRRRLGYRRSEEDPPASFDHAQTTDLFDFLSDNSMWRLHAAMHKQGITRMSDLTLSNIEALRANHNVRITHDQLQLLYATAIQQSRKKFTKSLSVILARSGGSRNHLVFISHCKAESGTEATLMKEEMVRMIREDPGSPGQNLTTPVFLDSDDLFTLKDLRRHVERSHNLVLLLTPTVITRPWCLVEIVAAVRAGVKIVPVLVERTNLKFEFPDESYYERLLAGRELNASAMDLLSKESVTLPEVESALRITFQAIAAPFSPHKSTNIRQAEMQNILRICHIRPRDTGQNIDKEETIRSQRSQWNQYSSG